MNEFMEHPEKLRKRFGTDVERGLTAARVEENRRQFGANSFSKGKKDSLGKRLWQAASEPMMLMLIAAACIALAVNITRACTGGEADFLECVGIFAAIALSVVITVVMEGRSAKAFEALSKLNEDTLVKVIREGEAQLIPQKELVAGDIVCVETGDKLPADGRLLESTSLKADESALTGESVPVKKDADFLPQSGETPVAERRNMLYSGSFITGGSGKLLVTGVGDQTEFGKIARELSGAQSASTPLQEKLAKLGKRITTLGVCAACIVFVIQLVLFIVHGTASFETISEAFITSIVLIVAAVPEGLPTIVAVSLAINIIKMSKQNALVKKMVACETVGCINVICSDKTGTLTENRMTVTGVQLNGHTLQPAELKEETLLNNFCLNGTANIGLEGEQVTFIGNPTECALLAAAQKAGWDYKAVREKADVAAVYPFSSETKNMTTVVKDDDGYMVYSKGSPEKILMLCGASAQVKQEIERQMLPFQEKACRVLAFAHKRMAQAAAFEEERELVESELTFDGFVAIADPLREDVLEAVQRCASAGIDLKMLTGDNLVTACAIANELKLLDGSHVALEAGQIDAMSDEELRELLPEIRVIARSTPLVKMRVVKALKEMGNVVAVTGDGINDAPAIKQADVGIAMGISGTEVSKEASDIVLLNDSFSTIVRAVQWGRGIYENFQRFIQFQLTVNLSSVVVVLCSILSGFAAPFTALQLLWINIIMDGPPALTLGLEPIRSDLMNRRPTRRDASIVSRSMLTRIAWNGLFISAVFMAQHTLNFMGGTRDQQPTILFTLFVVFQLFNAFNSRELTDTSILRNLGSNKLMLIVFAFTFSLQVLITQAGGAFFGTTPLPLGMWLKIIAVAFTVVLASELFRCLKRAFRKFRRTPAQELSYEAVRTEKEPAGRR